MKSQLNNLMTKKNIEEINLKSSAYTKIVEILKNTQEFELYHYNLLSNNLSYYRPKGPIKLFEIWIDKEDDNVFIVNTSNAFEYDIVIMGKIEGISNQVKELIEIDKSINTMNKFLKYYTESDNK